MKSKTVPVTIENISNLIDRKLVPVLGELDGIQKKISAVDGKVDTLNSKLEAHRQETKAGFEGVYDGLSALVFA